MTRVQTEQQEAERKKAEAEQQKLIMAGKYAALFGSELGQDILRDLEDMTGLRLRVFSPATAYDPIQSACVDGARGVPIYIQGMIDHHLKQKTQSQPTK